MTPSLLAVLHGGHGLWAGTLVHALVDHGLVALFLLLVAAGGVARILAAREP